MPTPAVIADNLCGLGFAGPAASYMAETFSGGGSSLPYIVSQGESISAALALYDVVLVDGSTGQTYPQTATLVVLGGKQLIGIGRPVLSFSGLGTTSDCVEIGGASDHAQVVFQNFVVNCNATGRDGVVLSRSDRAVVKEIEINDPERDGMVLSSDGDQEWIENARFDHVLVNQAGRHGFRLYAVDSAQAGTSFINENLFLQCEMRGCARRYDLGAAVYADDQTTLTGGKMSVNQFVGCNMDGERGGVGPGLDLAPGPLWLVAGSNSIYEAWSVIGGGWETVTGSPLETDPWIYAESGITANSWNVQGVVIARWGTELVDYSILTNLYYHRNNTGVAISDFTVWPRLRTSGDFGATIATLSAPGAGIASVDAFNSTGAYLQFRTTPTGAPVQSLVERLRINESGHLVWGVGGSGPFDFYGTGSPEGMLAAPVGSLYRRTDGGAATTLYVKESGTGNTGWVGK